MTQDIAKQSYRAVLCMSCRQPIPVPAIVISMGGLGETCPRPEDTERVFTLRCRACCRERPYRLADIIEFEGAPRPRSSYLRGPLGVRREQRGLSRAANG